MLENLGIFIYKYTGAPLYVSGQKKTQGLFGEGVFKVVSPNKFVIPDKIQSSIKGFNSCFFNNIKDPYIEKACERICPSCRLTMIKRKILY